MSKSASGKANSGSCSNNKKKYRDADWLREQYVVEEKSTREIAEEFDYGSTTICTWLDKHGIEKRSQGEAISKAKTPDALYTDKDWLQEQYVEKENAMREIANECGVSRSAIRRSLVKNDIETRPPGWNAAEDNYKSGPWDNEEWLFAEYVEKEKATTDIASEHGVSESLINSRLDKFNIPRRNTGSKGAKWHDGKNYTNSDWLQTEYIEKERSGHELAEECGVTPDTIYHWLERHEIQRRDYGYFVGEKHPAWNGGSEGVLYGSGWNESKKTAVRERDNFTCQDPNCSVTQKEYVVEHGQKLDVHHLKKARDVDDPEERNSMENLITLCRACHKKWEKMADAGLIPEMNLTKPKSK